MWQTGPWRMKALILILLSMMPICEATVAVINIEPLEDSDIKVRAHYGVITPLPCPSLLHSVCHEGDSSCIAHTLPSPLQGQHPPPGWCVRQWQQVIPREHSSDVHLGTSAAVVLSTRADLSIRKDKLRVNRPPFSALIPPIRVNAGCPRDIRLSTCDLDGDRVRCRYAQETAGECHGNCPQHDFLQLDEESCTLRYRGGAPGGQYHVKLMVEDFPLPIPDIQMDLQQALSSSPVYLSITVEAGVSDCPALPVFVDKTPVDNTLLPMLPYEEVKFNITTYSETETVLEMAVAGPPGLYVSQLKDEEESKKSVALSWVRDTNQLSRLLSICFTMNTNSLQSEIRCVWLNQKPMHVLPAGTVLNCNNTTMSLVLPISSMPDLPLDDLKLNDPSCPVLHNTTHVTAVFSLLGCGTKTVHAGSDLVYTNTLQSTSGISSLITRQARLVLPLACRIQPQQATGPRYKIAMPKEETVFGTFDFWVEFYRPGEGPLGNMTRSAKFRRSLRQFRGMTRAGRMETLDMYVFSNSSAARAQLMVGKCMESEKEDFSNASPLIDSGCSRNSRGLNMIVETPLIKVYRMDLSKLPSDDNMMYVECSVSLCVTTQASEKCPGPCDPPNPNANLLVPNFLSSNYTVRSGPISLLESPEPVAATAATATTVTTTTTTTATATTTTPTTPATTTPTLTTQATNNTAISSASHRRCSLALILTTALIHTLRLRIPH